MVFPTAVHRARSKLAPRPVPPGNEVGQPVEFSEEAIPQPDATPCVDSPLLIDGSPSRGIAGFLGYKCRALFFVTHPATLERSECSIVTHKDLDTSSHELVWSIGPNKRLS